MAQAGEFGVEFCGDVDEFGARGEFDFFFGEVEFEFEERCEFEEFFAEFFEAVREVSFHLAGGQAVGGTGVRGDDIGDGFGLGEVHAAVGEGTAREFAGFGESAAVVAEELQQATLHVARAVDGEFHGVFAGEGCRGAEDCRDGLIEELAVVSRVNDVAQMHGAWGLVGELFAAPEAVGSFDGPGTGDADYSDAADAGSGGYGADCIILERFHVCKITKKCVTLHTKCKTILIQQ